MLILPLCRKVQGAPSAAICNKLLERPQNFLADALLSLAFRRTFLFHIAISWIRLVRDLSFSNMHFTNLNNMDNGKPAKNWFKLRRRKNQAKRAGINIFHNR